MGKIHNSHHFHPTSPITQAAQIVVNRYVKNFKYHFFKFSLQDVITIEWLAALVTRQRDDLVQKQVQKLQIQQTIQTLQQTQYLSNPAFLRDYANLPQVIDQLNIQIAQEAQKVKNSRSMDQK